tara:strand:+ start:2439 stop:2837 length:399 start_codon:yes stop_codon:yes gene_type:complete
MAGARTLAPRLPLSKDDKHGYSMLTTVRQTTKQNFKCLILTGQGERVMDPEFGVGLYKYMFKQMTPETETEIKTNIRGQTAKYMPFIAISKVDFKSGSDPVSPNYNKMYVSITYVIKSIGVQDTLNLPLGNE